MNAFYLLVQAGLETTYSGQLKMDVINWTKEEGESPYNAAEQFKLTLPSMKLLGL
ncbi:hypothetical protein MHI18_03185 [Peribacillus sp. FSL H8-0477]|uniref:hypothetical protein n=1 Tax=Peribacillus sp. FSL H8-0477 TaxID=2921388 RepID=UPI0030FAEB1D